MSATLWSEAADRVERERQERNEQLRVEREAAEKRALQEKKDAEEALLQLQQFQSSDDFKDALKLLKVSWRSVFLGKVDDTKSGGWSRTVGGHTETREAPMGDTSYWLNYDGFEKSHTSWSPTYHGDFTPSDTPNVPAPLEEVALVAVRSGKTPVIDYIRKELDEIAAKAH